MVSQDAFRGIMLRGLDRLIPVGTGDVLGLEVATVTGTDPVTVHKLADPIGVDIQILTWWTPPVVGQRVWLLKTQTQRIIAGVHGGASSPPTAGARTSPSSLPGGGISKASQTSSSAAWQILDMDAESGDGISDLAGNRLILSPGVWSVSGGFSTDTFSTVRATRAAITTSTSTPGSDILVEASLPAASGVHGYSLGVARASFSVETSLYLRYLVDTSASHSILRAHLEAQRVQD